MILIQNLINIENNNYQPCNKVSKVQEMTPSKNVLGIGVKKNKILENH